ncbi:Golgi-associated plant pathogenesis-related protein 1-like [Actinia tenebrosa]|uniref:Golgi-associated plant pathogenesis-related protein 1-like n=1 Tax=Actinia tenebrosa TaxID=6105 RepID=A0A6P8HCL5_ACTTE|nr:Golgi-associated plant pathogenesis-related protein 1-like [Actinia tenebrosa]XP_031550426.1 Golgi-associated plant pathogenesis-related protein 1-like [Actinia tenebrosa]XP_031550427.1 Golgi-associated plant pathogenesis-related protein 1-like [Actinia tenebrosa]XP_031550428.1 Golgi-associated plant pathogenesis-related protein 1-like [Actinia tenebrosa]
MRGRAWMDFCFLFGLVFLAGPTYSRILQVFIPDSKSTVPHSALESHNKYRSIHHSPPLNWSDSLADQAQAIVDSMARGGSFSSGQRNMAVNLGQNLAKLAGFMTCDDAGEIATNLWYSQAKNYSYSDPRLNADTDTFTQVVWKDSKELGVGCARTPTNQSGPVYIVALYRPAGNIPRMLRQNVLAPGVKGNDPDVYSTLFRRNFKKPKRSKLNLP